MATLNSQNLEQELIKSKATLRTLLDTASEGIWAIQDEASCVVFGMPKEAIKRGTAEKIVPLQAMPGEIINA